ncbi:MAG: hypothetical protein JSW06_06560 [Thermoplasmatales archaeon]|nr:MAG: hypothetical protein JSW06_06560 [Thermoplasmatales archaeon]
MQNWERVVNQGFGDNNNVYAWSIKEYKKYLYIGTLNSMGCQIYRSKTGDFGTWEKISIDGFDKNAISAGVRNMCVYQNLLWVVTGSWYHGAQVWVTNGEISDKNGILKWKKASENGFGYGSDIPTIRSICIYKDKLYVGTRSKDFARIYRYDGLNSFEEINPNKWICINKDWMDNKEHNPHLKLAGQMIVYNTSPGKEYLYVGVYIDAIPLIYQFMEEPSLKNFLNIIRLIFLKCEIWRYDGNYWEKVIKNGYGKLNVMSLSARILNGSLYYGTFNMAGAEIWKTSNGIKWKRVVKRGFRKPFNLSVWGMQIYNNKIVVGINNPLMGCQVWASTTDNPNSNKDFEQISNYGMNSNIIKNFLRFKKQDGIQELESFKGSLYIGTASWMSYALKKKSSGCEVWRISNILE